MGRIASPHFQHSRHMRTDGQKEWLAYMSLGLGTTLTQRCTKPGFHNGNGTYCRGDSASTESGGLKNCSTMGCVIWGCVCILTMNRYELERARTIRTGVRREGSLSH